jgi:hypothetical protein
MYATGSGHKKPNKNQTLANFSLGLKALLWT